MNEPSHRTNDLVAELAGLSQTTIFHADTFKRARAAMKAAGLEIERLRTELADCRMSLDIYDPSHVSEYWLRYRTALDVPK